VHRWLFAFAKRGEICYTLGYYGLALAGTGGLAVLAWRVRRNKLKLRKEKSK